MNVMTRSIAATLAAATLGLAAVAPASADQAARTRNTILGAAAVVAGIAIESNVARKRAQANSITGYLPDGSTVYADGRVVSTDGQTYYPNQNGGNLSCDNGNCYVYGNGNAPANNGGYYGNNGGYYGNNGGYYGNNRYGDGRDRASR